MQISFFVPRCTPDNSHGRYVVELAKRFGPDHSVTVYSGSLWAPLRSVVHYQYLPVPIRPAAGRLAVLWTAAAILNRRKPSDIVHIQGADAAVGNVVTAHCCNPAMRVAAGGGTTLHRRLNYSIGSVVERHCMSKASTRRIIAVSNKVKEEVVREYRVDPERIVVIPHGVDGEVFHPRHRSTVGRTARVGLGIGLNELVAMFVGGEYRLKGLVRLLRASRRLSDRVRVLAVGVRPDAALKRVLRQEDLSGTVSFVEHTAEVASLYAAVDCFVLPTRYDTFSMSTLEALASGLPVIVSRAAGVTELLTAERDCLVLEDPENVEALGQHLGRLVASESLRARLGTAGRQTAERLSWDVVAARTLGVYGDVVGDAIVTTKGARPNAQSVRA